MKSKLLLLLAMLCVGKILFAQEAQSQGKIITSTKTYDGYVSVNALDETPQSFKIQLAGEERLITPEGEILRVQLQNGITYQKFATVIAKPAAGYLERRQHHYDKPVEAGTFLQLLVSGSANLYQLKDEYGFLHFFYNRPGEEKVTNLVYQPYVSDDEMIIQDVAYRNQILNLRNAICPSAALRDERLTWETGRMIEAFKKINSCGSSVNTVDHYTATSKTKLSVSLLAAVSSGSFIASKNNENWERKTVPSYGFSISFYPKYNKRSISFGLDAFYMKFESGSSTMRQYNVEYRNYYKSSQVFLRPFLRIFLTDRKIVPVADLGVTFAVSGKSDLILNIPYGIKGAIPVTLGTMPYAALGVNINSFTVQAHYFATIGGAGSGYFNNYGITARYAIF